MKEIQAPAKYDLGPADFTIFLAGSIEMGTAEQWQKRVLEEFEGYDVHVFNPRRDDWDSSWEQRASNPDFREQVEWELQALDDSNLVIFYFSPGTRSPVTLLELGLFAHENIFVCCPDGYWRKGNVEIVMSWYRRSGVVKGRSGRLFDDLDVMLDHIKDYISDRRIK